MGAGYSSRQPSATPAAGLFPGNCNRSVSAAWVADPDALGFGHPGRLEAYQATANKP